MSTRSPSPSRPRVRATARASSASGRGSISSATRSAQDDQNAYALIVITQRQLSDGSRRNGSFPLRQVQDRAVQSRIRRHPCATRPSARDARRAAAPFTTIVESVATYRFYNEAHRTCPKCGHVNPRLPLELWGVDRYASQSEKVRRGRKLFEGYAGYGHWLRRRRHARSGAVHRPQARAAFPRRLGLGQSAPHLRLARLRGASAQRHGHAGRDVDWRRPASTRSRRWRAARSTCRRSCRRASADGARRTRLFQGQGLSKLRALGTMPQTDQLVLAIPPGSASRASRTCGANARA